MGTASSLIGAFFLLLFSVRVRNPQAFRAIWKDRSVGRHSIGYDVFMGILTLILSFPLVIVVGQLADLLLYHLFQFHTFEQVAVRYLKNTLESPAQMIAALLMLLGLAPFLEEFLFRGCFQTFLRRYLSPSKAIFCSALFFAFFHYAGSQGIGNVSLIASLFVFALFLGFIYEKQGSLFASITAHTLFNLVSCLRILFDTG